MTTHAAFDGERKLVTVVFCDIANSTSLAERIGSEPMHGLLNKFFKLALREVHRYGGTINQFLGDGFMALFGAPLAHEDHAYRAARAALALQRVVKVASGEFDFANELLQLRIGLNTGHVVVGKLGDDLRMDYTAVGDTTNLAARMQQAARPGEIFLGESTQQIIQHQFKFDDLGERKVKGKDRAVQMYRLRELSAQPADSVLRMEMGIGSVMVGRERECALLMACVTRLQGGSGCVIGILGEAGVGKSRLQSEMREAAPPGMLWLEARALSFGQTISYAPFSDIFRSLAGITPRDSQSEVWDNLTSWLETLMGEEGRNHSPYVGTLLGCDLPADLASHMRRLDAKDVRGQIYISTRKLIEKIAGMGPLVLEFDDWHWADEASAALLEHLFPLTEYLALLILFAGRHEADTPCARARARASQTQPQRYVDVLLSPLSSSDSSLLIDNLVGQTQLPARLRGLILERADGNPLFLEEVIRSLIATHVLARDHNGRLSVMVPVEQIALPEKIEAMIVARIDRLEEDVKDVLKLAAVIGRSFYQRILQALDQTEHHLDECLRQLQQFELIRQTRVLPELEYVFRHALVQEASYLSILAERRHTLHRLVGESIERLFADRLQEFASFLAYHFARAEQWEKAQVYLLLAGDQASQMAADAEAATHYAEAIQAYARAFGDRWDPLQRATVERKIGEALFRLGRHDQAAEHLHKTLSLLGVRYPKTRWGVRLHIVGNVLQQLWHQVSPTRYGRRVEPSQADLERVRTFVALSWLDFWRDEEKYFFNVISCLNWAERKGIRMALAQGSSGLAVACDVLGAGKLAVFYHRRALKVAAEFNDPISNATAEFFWALHQCYGGSWAAAAAGMERTAAVFKGQGKLRERGVAGATLIWLLQARGDLAHAQTILTELGQVADDAGDTQIQFFSKVLGAVSIMHQGRLAESAAQLQECIVAGKAIPDYQGLCECYGNQASCALFMGDLRLATAAVGDGLALLRSTRIAPHNTDSLLWSRGWLARIVLEQAEGKDKAAARKGAQAALGALRRLAGDYAGAIPMEHCLRGSVHWLGGSHSRARDAWDRAMEAAEQIGSRIHLALIHQEVGRLTRSRSNLDEGLRIFEEMGASLQVARTLRYLGQAVAQDKHDDAARFFERALSLHEHMNAEYEYSLVQAEYRRVKAGRD